MSKIREKYKIGDGIIIIIILAVIEGLTVIIKCGKRLKMTGGLKG